jgi:enolase
MACVGAAAYICCCLRLLYPRVQVKIGMDVAASEFQTEDKMYDLKFKDKENDGSGKKTG